MYTDKPNIDFKISTLLAIRQFQDGIKELITDYPDFDFKDARNFIKTGEKKESVSSKIYDKISSLNEIRKSAIKKEMTRAKAQMEIFNSKRSENPINIPEELLDGSSLVPFFDQKFYELFPSLGTFQFMQWYSEEEVANLVLEQEAQEKAESPEQNDEER